jgi:DNA-binding response OmpR family regulator
MRLLIADENASLRKQFKRYFETRGHQVETARDGVEACRWCSSAPTRTAR